MSFPNIKLILLIVSLFCLGGCASRAASPVKTAGNIDPCSLITKEEAAAALGGDVEVTSKAGDKACAYSLTRTSLAGSVVVMVVTSDSPDFQKFGMSRDPRTEAKPISGVGDRAVLFMSKESPDKGAKAMQVLKGNAYVAIGMGISTPPVSEDVLKTLAAKALGRLP